MSSIVKMLCKCILFFVLLVPVKIIGQSVQIETTNLRIVDKKLEITYDILKNKNTQRFKVWVEINNSKGAAINALNFSGDVGDNMTGGRAKIILWDYNADGILLDEEIEVVVKAELFTLEGAVKPGNAFFKSLVFPGWGLSSVDKGKPYWLIGVVGYASLGSSLMLKSSYKNNYDKYLETSDPDESTSFYNKSRSQKSLSQALGYAAIGTWAISAVWTLVKANKINNSLIAGPKQKPLLFYSTYDPATKTSGFTLIYNF